MEVGFSVPAGEFEAAVTDKSAIKVGTAIVFPLRLTALCYDLVMTEDALIRAAAVGLSIPIWVYLIQKAKPHCARGWQQIITVLPKKLGKLCGRIRAFCNKHIK